jgi:phage/plasmid primase-like uncharacterized protein
MQLFFRSLIVASKVKFAAKVTREALRHGSFVLIALQSTGETGQLNFFENEGEINNFFSTT